MSFRCERCGKVQPNGTKPVMVQTAVRPVNYVGYTEHVNRQWPHNPPTFKQIRQRSSGDEIVEEKRFCQTCATVEANCGEMRVEGGHKTVHFNLRPGEVF
ncbi:MAG: hypothetical protein ABH822_01825 [Patescibacteria group bacterium]